MAGFPAFQGNAFQANAFQAGWNLVAGDYTLGSPSFAKPALGENFHLNAPSYSLGSPSFATPTLTISQLVLHAPSYSLGSPSFATPSMRGYQALTAQSLTVGSPDFSAPAAITQTQNLAVNRYDLEPLAWSPVSYQHHYRFSATDYFLPSPSYAPPNPPATIDVVWSRADYVLGSPSFGFPMMTAMIPAHTYYPPSYLSQVEQADTIVTTWLNYIQSAIPNTVNAQTNTARALIYDLRANVDAAVRSTTLGAQMQAIVIAAQAAGATYAGVEAARAYLMTQIATQAPFPLTIATGALNMTLGLEANIIAGMTFDTSDDAQAMLLHCSTIFEQAKQLALTIDDPASFEAILAVGGSVINYLASQQMQLPRFIGFDARAPLPSLYLAQRIYADPSRAQEIETENGVVHPAFCPRLLRVLSNAGY